MEVILEVNCPECGDEITINSLHIDDKEKPAVNVMEFSQTSWYCEKCEKTFLIGDIDVVSEDDV